MEELEGRVVKSYELQNLIGVGAFGAVYRAYQQVVDREVAVKIIWPAFANHPNFIRRFDTEAQVIAGLEHPHIVPLYDYWREPDGAYLVMRWLRGGPLRHEMGQPWKVEDVYQLVTQVSAALSMAHRLGVVHRDLKPENILLDEMGNAYLADFGIAQIISNVQDTDDEFASMGSPAYAAPEQVAGGITTPQTDIYSMGVIIYEMLVGEHPFPDLAEMSQTRLTNMRINSRMPSLLMKRDDLPPALDKVVQQATELNPRDRFMDVLAMARAFRSALEYDKLSTMEITAIRAVDQDPDTDFSSDESVLSGRVNLLNPYKGLRAFQEADAENFYGRRELVFKMVNRLKEENELNRFLAVVGPSGSGKSSVVKAGLVPTLRKGALPGSENWYYIDMVPGTQPFQELSAALNGIAVQPSEDLEQQIRMTRFGLLRVLEQLLPEGKDGEVFLVIDQFEEIFTLTENPRDTSLFLEALNNAVMEPNSNLRVVITLRADFYDRPLLRPKLSGLMSQRTEVVVPLNEDELQQAIVKPAERLGVFFDQTLVNAIISEVSEQTGTLPLLQYSLAELFERRQGNRITMKAFEEIGGVRGALARRTDEIYEEFDMTQKEVARQLFLRLITLGEGTEDTRRRANLTELTAIAGGAGAVRYVVDTLGKSRLLIFDRDPSTRTPTVEVTHEAIIREWQRLRGWLDESRNDVRMQRGLASLTQEWLNSGQDPSFLLRGARLEQYERWAEVTNLALTEEESGFLTKSRSERDRLEEEERARQQRERSLEERAQRRLQILVVVLLIAAVGAFSLTAFAFRQSENAQNEAARAENALATSDANARLSQSLALEASARRALGENDGDLAVTLALVANQMSNPPVQARRTLAEVALTPGTRQVFAGHNAWVAAVALSPDGTRAVSGSTDATLKVWDTATGETLHILEGHRGDVESVVFSPDGRFILSAAADFAVILWDAATGQEVRRFMGHTQPVRSAVFSADGRQVLSGASDDLLILWDVESGQEIRRFVGHQSSVLTVALSPDGTRALSGGREDTLYYWDVATAQVIARLAGHTTAITHVTFSPDGTQAASSAADGSIIIWDLATGNVLRELNATDEVRAVAYTPDGTRLLSGSIDGLLQFWDLEAGEEIYRLEGHTLDVMDVVIADNGELALSGSKDTTMRLWNINAAGELLRFNEQTSRISQLAFSPDGSRLYSAAGDGSMWAINPADGSGEVTYIATEPVMSMVLGEGATNVIVGLQDGYENIVNLDSGEIERTFSGHNDSVLDVTLSPDGTRALSSSRDGFLIYWNPTTGEEVRRIAAHDGSIFAVAMSPDGTAFSGGRDGEIVQWNLDTGAEINRFLGHTGAVYSLSVSPDGSRLLSGSRDSSVILWDVANAREIQRLAGHSDTVWEVTFSPSGETALSGSADGDVILWDVIAGQALQRFEGNEDIPVYSVAFNHDGTLAASGKEDGTVQVWRIFSTERLDELIAWTNVNRYVRELTCAEREQFRVEPYCRDEA